MSKFQSWLNSKDVKLPIAQMEDILGKAIL